MPNDLFLSGNVMQANVGDLAALQEELQRLQMELDPESGLRDTMLLALGMLHRWSSAHVRVDTGRLKNSLFWDVEGRGNDLVGHMATNVEYGPWVSVKGLPMVRAGGNDFMQTTAEREGPNVNDLFGFRVSRGRVGR